MNIFSNRLKNLILNKLKIQKENIGVIEQQDYH